MYDRVQQCVAVLSHPGPMTAACVRACYPVDRYRLVKKTLAVPPLLEFRRLNVGICQNRAFADPPVRIRRTVYCTGRYISQRNDADWSYAVDGYVVRRGM